MTNSWLDEFVPGPVIVRSVSYAVPPCNGQVVIVSSLSAAITITLPAAPVTGQIVVVKRATAQTTTITIAGNGKLIDGVSYKTLTIAWESCWLAYTGEVWAVIGTGSTSAVVGFTSPVLLDTVKVAAAIAIEDADGTAVACKADAASAGTAYRVVALAGTAGTPGSLINLRSGDEITCTDDTIWDTSHPTEPDVGKQVFLSPTNVGNLTIVEPATGGVWKVPIGSITFASDAVGAVRMAIRFGDPEWIVAEPE